MVVIRGPRAGASAAWGQTVHDDEPTLALVLEGPWEIVDNRLPRDTVWRHPGDPVFDQYLLTQMAQAIDVLSAGGADVIWLISPPIGPGAAQAGEPEADMVAHPERMRRFDQLVQQLPSLRPGKVHVVDLAGYLASTGNHNTLRPDGVHVAYPAQPDEVAATFLMDAVLSAYQQEWHAGHGG